MLFNFFLDTSRTACTTLQRKHQTYTISSAFFQKMIFHSFNILLKEQENKTENETFFPALLCSTAASTIFLASSTINIISTVTTSVFE